MCCALVQWQMGHSQSSHGCKEGVSLSRQQLGEPQHPQDVSGHISLSLADGGESQVCAWWRVDPERAWSKSMLCPHTVSGSQLLGIGMWTSLGVISPPSM